MTTPHDNLFQRLAGLDMRDPEAMRALGDDPAMRDAARAVLQAHEQGEFASQHTSAHRPMFLSNAAMAQGHAGLYLAAASAWVTALAGDGPEAKGERYKVAAHVIAEDAKFPGDPTERDAAAARLQARLGEAVRELDEAFRDLTDDGPRLGEGDTQHPLPWNEGALALDAALVEILKKTGPKGLDLANQTASESKESGEAFSRASIDLAQAALGSVEGADRALAALFALWLPAKIAPIARFALRLARALWTDEVRAESIIQIKQRERLRKNPPSLTRAAYAPALSLLGQHPVREVGDNGQVRLRLPGELTISAVHTDAIAAPFLDRGIDLFRSIYAHKVIRHFVFEGHRRWFSGVQDPRLLEFSGGYSALAEAMGINGRKGAEQARMIVEAMHCLDVPIMGATTRLVNRTFTPARGQQPAHLFVEVGVALVPTYVHDIEGNSLDARRARDLIPLLPLPPIIGRPNEAGAQATLSMMVVRYLRDQAPELAQHGHAPMPIETFARMARDASLPPKQARPLLDRWLQDDPAAAIEERAFLKQPEPGRFTLGDAHAAERDFLADGGQRTINGAKNGQMAARKRAQARDKGQTPSG